MKKWFGTACGAVKRHLAVGCYLLAAALLLLWMLANFALDGLLYATGRLYEQTVTLADSEKYTLVNMEQAAPDTLLAQTGDAQLLLQPGQRIRTLRLVAEYETAASNEMDLYWHLPGGGYTARQRIWPARTADGTGWLYRLPLWAGKNVRLDLADQAGVTVRVTAVVLNERPAWYVYFTPSGWQLFWLAVLPGLAACALALLRDVCAARKTKEHPKKGDVL